MPLQALLRVWFTYLGRREGGKTILSIIDKNICKTLRIMFRKRWDSAIPLGKKPP